KESFLGIEEGKGCTGRLKTEAWSYSFVLPFSIPQNVARHGTRFIHASHWIVNRHAHHRASTAAAG
ncbi:hypothetical protein, partial [Pseudomonas aeruginosa]|uniref:hypothetical protein n=1 Tax=Pseudomonas aeruginosa TaxID=287 RepID=UPI001F43875B